MALEPTLARQAEVPSVRGRELSPLPADRRPIRCRHLLKPEIDDLDLPVHLAGCPLMFLDGEINDGAGLPTGGSPADARSGGPARYLDRFRATRSRPRSRRAWQMRVERSQRAARLAAGSASGFASALPEPAGLSGIERTSAGLDPREALERLSVRRQHLSFRSPLPYFHNGSPRTYGRLFTSERGPHRPDQQDKSGLSAIIPLTPT